MSLHRLLTRLIWLCIGPLVLLAAYLAFDSVMTRRADRDLEAANLAKSFATTIDRYLNGRIGALRMLAGSPLLDDASRLEDLYREAQGFHQSFGSHVILADLEMRMLFNTRVPFGTKLPPLPRPKGSSAVAVAVETGQPAVGDTFPGPIAREPLVAIAVPALREGKTAFFLLTTLETRLFRERLDQAPLPSGWSLALIDSKGEVIARRAPPDLNPAADVDASGRFLAKSSLSPWSVRIEIPRGIYRKPMLEAAAALAIAILGATLIAIFGGILASRRIGRAVASLARTPAAGEPPPEIAEIAAVRRLLDESAEKRESAEAARRESEERFRATFEQAAVGIARVAPDGRWLRVNRKLCDIVGYSRDELLARSFQNITHPDDREADLARLRQMLAGRIETYSVDKRYIRRDGSPVWVKLTGSLVRKPDGTPDYFIAVIEDIQAAKRAEAVLREYAAALQTAQRLAGVGNWSWDIGTGVHTWSDEIYRIYGRDPVLPPAVYPEVRNYFTPESWETLSTAVEKGMAEGVPYECDAEVVRPDGTHRWIVARGEATRDASGKVVSLQGTVQDITERKRAEAALITSESGYRSIFEGAAEGIITINSATMRIGNINPAICKFFGYAREEFSRLSIENLFPRESLPGVIETFQAMSRSETDQAREVPCLRKEGFLAYMDIASTNIVLNHEPCLLLFFTDATARHHAEVTKSIRLAVSSLLSRSAEVEATLTDILKVVCTEAEWSCGELWWMDPASLMFTGRECWCQPGHEGLDPFQSAISSISFARNEGLPGRALTEGRTIWVGKLSADPGFRRRDLATAAGLNSAMAIPIVSDNDVVAVVIFFSVSERPQEDELLVALTDIGRQIGQFLSRKRIEAALAEERASLAGRVDERTAALRVAIERAESANKAKSDFLASTSHELRTPLNAIIGFSDIMLGGFAGPFCNDQQKEFLRDIYESGLHLLSLINDILDLSKVEAGKMELEETSVSIQILLQNSMDLFKEKTFKHGIKLTMGIDIGEEDDIITADARKIKQVLFNLLSNAVKFTPDSGEIFIGVRKVKVDDSDFVQFSITDTGIGISAENQKKLFLPFQQIDNSSTRQYQGSGLGLSLCKGFVELHGGKIWVTSREGRGSTFFFTIPVH